MALSPAPTAVTLNAEALLSRRHVPSILGLALAAGEVNAAAFVLCERFVTHVTGTVTRIGLDVGQWLLVTEYSLVLMAFVAGAMLSVLAIQRRVARGRRPRPDVPLLGAGAVLVLTAAAGSAGLFGTAAGAVEQTGDFVFLSLLALAMGLMNATVASSTALALRTTHMTGPATDFGVSLASAWCLDGAARRQALSLAALRGGKVACFVFGAAVMLPVVHAFGYAAFVLPALLIAVAARRSFAHDAIRSAVPSGQGTVAIGRAA